MASVLLYLMMEGDFMSSAKPFIGNGPLDCFQRRVCVHGVRQQQITNFVWKIALGMILVSMVGCTSWHDYIHNGFKVGPNYAKPEAKTADNWIDVNNPNVSTEAANDAAWWQHLNDPTLTNLVYTAYRQNLTIRTAGARIVQARAQRAIVVGNLFPQNQQAAGSYDRNNLSKNSANVGDGMAYHYDDWQVGSNLSWELDFWGYYRRAVESANASLNVSIENYDAALVLMLSEVAQRYVYIRTYEQQLEFARKNVEIQRKSLNLATVKFQNGATTKLDVTQGELTLAQTEATIPPLESARREAGNELCILLGIPPQDLEAMIGKSRIPSVQPQVAVGVPADLLRRRPDIRSAEREVAAQCAQIGVSTALLYPHFSINGSIYFDSENFKNLLRSESFGGSVGPSFNWNILNYGRLKNGILVQDALFQQLVFTYQNKVLQANAEAENSLVRFLNDQLEIKSLDTSVKAAGESLVLVLDQYNEGKTDFNRVLTIEQQLTQQQNQLASAQGSVVQNLVLLYKALGGGWQIRLNGSSNSPEATGNNAGDNSGMAPTPADANSAVEAASKAANDAAAKVAPADIPAPSPDALQPIPLPATDKP
jgi:NodT family efflux transporter outer membrane factor (OMF) lipoprotein